MTNNKHTMRQRILSILLHESFASDNVTAAEKYVKQFFNDVPVEVDPSAGAEAIDGHMRHIYYDTRVSIEDATITIMIRYSSEASGTDKKLVTTDITKQLKSYFSDKASVKKVTSKAVKASTDEPVSDGGIDITIVFQHDVDKTQENIANKIVEAIYSNNDAVCVELTPAIIDESELGVIIDNVDNVTSAENFTAACKRMIAEKLVCETDNDVDVLCADFNADNAVIIKAPKNVALSESTKVLTWITTISESLRAAGFNVTVNMEEDTDPSEFEQIEEPEVTEEKTCKAVKEANEMLSGMTLQRYDHDAEEMLPETDGKYVLADAATEVIDTLNSRIAILNQAIKTAIYKFDRVAWGWDGDAGSAAIMAELENVLDETE